MVILHHPGIKTLEHMVVKSHLNSGEMAYHPTIWTLNLPCSIWLVDIPYLMDNSFTCSNEEVQCTASWIMTSPQ